jgi:8-oxo-dGTP pyrophosphatase MutT (NUDIX family)
MGFPKIGTIDVPSQHPELAAIAASALSDPDGARDELVAGLSGGPARPGHLCANAWAYNDELTKVLLVEHPKFSWTNPGGHLDPGEWPAAAAARELCEETGAVGREVAGAPVAIVATLLPAAGGHAEHMHYTFSYAFIVDESAPLVPEPGQRAAWFDLAAELPEGFFADNWRSRDLAALLRR